MPPRRLFLAATLALALAPAAGLAQGLNGSYQVDARALDGSRHGGQVEITETDGRLDVLWHDGDATLPGAGLREGRVVTIAWGYDGDEPSIYVLMPNGDLLRSWNAEGMFERLIFIP